MVYTHNHDSSVAYVIKLLKFERNFKHTIKLHCVRDYHVDWDVMDYKGLFEAGINPKILKSREHHNV